MRNANESPLVTSAAQAQWPKCRLAASEKFQNQITRHLRSCTAPAGSGEDHGAPKRRRQASLVQQATGNVEHTCSFGDRATSLKEEATVADQRHRMARTDAPHARLDATRYGWRATA